MNDLFLVAVVIAAMITIAVLQRLRQRRSRKVVEPRCSYNCLTIRMIADERAAYRRVKPEIVAD